MISNINNDSLNDVIRFNETEIDIDQQFADQHYKEFMALLIDMNMQLFL